MFRFLELELHHWDLWHAARVPLDGDVILVTGPNGSGKTTLIDAIRQLLNASRLSSRRRLQHYLRRPDAPALIRALVSNRDGTGAAPPFRRERITTPEVTLACAIVPAGGGTPERRFAIVPGRPSLDELRAQLLDSRDFYPPERYGRALEHAGVTRSLLSVLAIEQGKTNSLFELTPHQLFQRVLEMLGDHAILERYRDARRRYEESYQELNRQVLALHTAQAQLTEAQREVRRLAEWEQAREKVADLEARLPAAELQRLLREQAESTSNSRALQTKVRRGEVEQTELDARLRQATGEEAGAREALEGARTAEARAREGWGAATRAETAAAVTLGPLEAKQREVETLSAGDLDALVRESDETARALFRAEENERAAVSRAAEATEKEERLARGLPDYPPAVTRTLEVLQAEGIETVILASTVEVADADLAESVEAALGDARYALLVSPSEHDRAVKVARSLDFPGPVYSGPRTAVPERAGPLALAPGAPGWLPTWLMSIDLTGEGPWSDARGTWVARVRERVLGAAGREAALAQARGELDAARQRLAEAHQATTSARARHDTALAALDAERRRRELVAQLAALPEALAEAARARMALQAAEEWLQQAIARREAEHATFVTATRERLAVEAETHAVAARLAGERKALDEVNEELRANEERIRGLEVTPELRARAERGELDGPDTVRADLRRAQDAFAALAAPPPPEIREEAKHLHANVEDLARHVADRRREADDARAELAECRMRYLEVVSSTLGDYRRRAETIGRGAHVAVEMELPRLADDDRALDEAGIQVRFGFDGKEPLPLGDPSFSGGQQVIAGLILLMAMAETDGHGFFMLDEPFAHLSIDRIDDVGRFLRGTRSQFILTAPTTLDRAQLDPASLLVVLQKKRPAEPFAPVPIVAAG